MNAVKLTLHQHGYMQEDCKGQNVKDKMTAVPEQKLKIMLGNLIGFLSNSMGVSIAWFLRKERICWYVMRSSTCARPVTYRFISRSSGGGQGFMTERITALSLVSGLRRRSWKNHYFCACLLNA